EAGGGTDPNEGGALATAIIDHFRRRGAMVMATTHFDALKTYASTTEGVTSAGFGFNPETFAPTYRLHYGSPGSSLALEIATRLGDARREIDTVVDALKARAASIPAGRLVSTGDIGAARSDARAALDGVESKLREGVGPTSSPSVTSSGQSRPVAEGDRVA